MLTNFEVVLYAVSTIIVLPIALWSLTTGSQAPENSGFAKYYAAERYLGVTGNLFLLAVCANALMKLSRHFGIINFRPTTSTITLVSVLFLLLLVLYIGMWIRAMLKVRRNANG